MYYALSFQKMMEVGAHIVVHGRVQGVGFRYFVSTAAQRLGLSGYVRNRPDGCVEVVAEGERAAIEELVAVVRGGPRMASVTEVEVTWSGEGRRFDGFEIR